MVDDKFEVLIKNKGEGKDQTAVITFNQLTLSIFGESELENFCKVLRILKRRLEKGDLAKGHVYSGLLSTEIYSCLRVGTVKLTVIATPDGDEEFVAFTSADAGVEHINKLSIGLEAAVKLADSVLNHFGIECPSGDYLNPRVELVVSYEEKDLVKIFGAKWDIEKRIWYMPACDYFPFPIQEFISDEDLPLVVSFDN